MKFVTREKFVRGLKFKRRSEVSVIIKKMMSFRFTRTLPFIWSKIVFHSGKSVVLWLEVEVEVIWTVSQVENKLYKFLNEFLDSNWWMVSLRVHCDFNFFLNFKFFITLSKNISKKITVAKNTCQRSFFIHYFLGQKAETQNATFLTIFLSMRNLTIISNDTKTKQNVKRRI